MKTASRNPDVWEKAQHFDIQKHWRKLGPIFRSDAAAMASSLVIVVIVLVV